MVAMGSSTVKSSATVLKLYRRPSGTVQNEPSERCIYRLVSRLNLYFEWIESNLHLVPGGGANPHEVALGGF